VLTMEASGLHAALLPRADEDRARVSWRLMAACFLGAMFILSVGGASGRQALYAATAQDGCRRRIWVIRHGEKSPAPCPGSPEVLGLNSTGWQRASYLQKLVTNHTWPAFSHVFASSPRLPPHVLREVQTVEPLAAILGIPVNATFAQDEISALASAALEAASSSCGATVLISFEHCRIPWLLMALGCSEPICVGCWADGVYDRFIVLESDTSGHWVATARREKFRDDNNGFDDYECAGAQRLQHTRCQQRDGSWLGSFASGEQLRHRTS